MKRLCTFHNNKGVYLALVSMFLSFLLSSCLLNTPSSTVFTNEKLGNAESHLECLMENYEWISSQNSERNTSSSFAISSSLKNHIRYKTYTNQGDEETVFTYEIKPYMDNEYVRLSLRKSDNSSSVNTDIHTLDIKLSKAKEGILLIKINDSPDITFSKTDEKVFEESEKPNCDDTNENTEEKEELPPLPEINDNPLVTTFVNDLRSFEWATFDMYSRVYKMTYSLTDKSECFMYEYKWTGCKLYDPITNKELKNVKVQILFTPSFTSYPSSSHFILNGERKEVYIESEGEYYLITDTSTFIDKIQIEVKYSSPSSYHVLVTDYDKRYEAKEQWTKV